MVSLIYLSYQLTSFYVNLLNTKILNLAVLPVPVYIWIPYPPDESLDWPIWTDKSLSIASNSVGRSNAKEPLRSPALETPQVECDQPVSVGNASSNVGQADPEDAIYGKSTEEISYIISPRIEGQPTLEPDHLSKLSHL